MGYFYWFCIQTLLWLSHFLNLNNYNSHVNKWNKIFEIKLEKMSEEYGSNMRLKGNLFSVYFPNELWFKSSSVSFI